MKTWLQQLTSLQLLSAMQGELQLKKKRKHTFFQVPGIGKLMRFFSSYFLTIPEEKHQKLCRREETQQANLFALSNTMQSKQVFWASIRKVTQII